MGEIKQANFRINEDTAAKFRAFCEENGYSQAQGFDHVIEVLELNGAKTAIPERSVDIETFEMHTKAIMDAYLKNLEITAQTQARVREEFASSIDKNEKLIKDLQKKIELLTEENKRFSKELASADAEARQAVKEKQSVQTLLDESYKVRDMQQRDIDTLNAKLTELGSIKDEASQLKSSLEHADDELKTCKNDLAQANSKNEELKKAVTLKDEEIKALKNDIDQIKTEKTTLNEELIKAEKNYEKTITEAIKDAEISKEKEISKLKESHSEELSKIREDNAALKAQLDLLKSDILITKQK